MSTVSTLRTATTSSEYWTTTSTPRLRLYKAILAGNTASKYDLNGDGSVNVGDVSALYQLIIGH